MTNEAPEDSDSLESLGKRFDASHIGNILHVTVSDQRTAIHEVIGSIQALLPYLTNTHYADIQRQVAERELRRLCANLAVHTDALQNTLSVASELQHPVAVNT